VRIVIKQKTKSKYAHYDKTEIYSLAQVSIGANFYPFGEYEVMANIISVPVNNINKLKITLRRQLNVTSVSKILSKECLYVESV